MTIKNSINILLGVIIALLTLASTNSFAQKTKRQSREQLETQRLSILEEIKRTQAQLEVLQKDKQASMSQFLALQAKLNARQMLVANISKEMNVLENNIHMVNKDVDLLRSELDTLKKQYAEMVRYTYKNRTSSDLIVFLFSASSFNDAIRRLSYVKQYRGFRADQAQKVVSASKQLTNKMTVLNNQKQQKDFVLKAQEQQNKILEQETIQKDRMLMMLKGQEKELLAGLAQKKKAAENLNKAIASAIKREIDLATKRAVQERVKQDRERKAKEAIEKKKMLVAAKNAKLLSEKTKREAAAKQLAIEKKQQEDNERRALAEKQKREEAERKLVIEQKERETRQRALELEKKQRLENEKKATLLAESKRKEREEHLALEKKRQEERERQLIREKQKQEEQQNQLMVQKQRAEEEQRRLAEEKKRQEREAARLLSNVPYNNPRYIAAAIASDKSSSSSSSSEKLEEVEVENTSSSNTKTFAKDDYKFGLTPEERQISNTLESSKGRLPWPVEKGYVAEHFGKNKHPLFNIVTENYGVDIKTSRGAAARTIFPGEVSTVISIPGTGQTVIVNHGSFFTVYAKLSGVNVTKGSKVGLKQKIGNVMTDEDGNTQIHFEIWKVGANGSPFKLNPEQWIAQ